MKRIPKTGFKAVCIKAFNIEANNGGRKRAWGCLELFRTYEFTNFYGSLRTRVKVANGVLGAGSYADGFNIARDPEGATDSVPYFWDHFVLIKE